MMNDDVETLRTNSKATADDEVATPIHEKDHESKSPEEFANPRPGILDTQVEEVKRVPVIEAIRYRKRAQAAEKQVEDLQEQLALVEEHLHETKVQIDDAQRDQEIHQALVDAGAMDVDTARLLVQKVLDEGTGDSGGCGIEEVVRVVRERKPFLFRADSTESNNSAVMGGHLRPLHTQRATPLHHAASEARHSGRKQDLLRYMRLRRAEH